MKFDLLCIDMFQTLVDMTARYPIVWRRILADRYNEALAAECAKSVTRNVFQGFQKSASGGSEFINLKTMFRPFFETVLSEMNISYDAEEAVRIYIEEHAKAELFEDVKPFFAQIQGKLPVCLVTDADDEMVLPLLNMYPFDSVFISEKTRSYKNEPESRIFKDVLKHYAIDPQKVLHIGDSSSDILGASRVGIQTCWINRDGSEWMHTAKPDYTVTSLIEVIPILFAE